jgi:uncharacterized protein YukE
MSSVKVTVETLDEFKNNYKKSNEKLQDLIEKMAALNDEYGDAMISKSANKYKEVFNTKLEEEKEELKKDNFEISNKLDVAIKEYSEAHNIINRKVGG